jgi:DNA-binding MurR/RpiR family transcriptional regulator
MSSAEPPLRQRLAALESLSGVESALAIWMERNLLSLPFESAVAVAEGAGVSEMSVARFVSRLGSAPLYARTFLTLAAEAARTGLPLVVVTDRFGTWARRYTPHVLSVSTQTGT